MTEFVKYIGTSHIRKISRQDWAGIPDNPIDHPTVVWNAANGWTIPRHRISDDAWPYIMADGEFIVIGDNPRVKVDADNEGVVNVKEYPPLTTAQSAEWLDHDPSGVVDPDAELEAPTNQSGGVTLQPSVENSTN